MKRSTSWQAAVLVALCFGAVSLGAMSDEAISSQLFDEERVKAAAVVGATPLVQGEVVRAAVEIQVGRGFHVNANPASEDFLIATGVSLDAPGIEIVDIYYPDPLERTFGFWPEALKVWEGNVVAGLVLRVTDAAAVGDADLHFIVDYQACNDEACFAPAQTTARVPTMVASSGTPSREVASPLLEGARFEDSSS